MKRQLCCEDYTVGWVCALPVELAAAQLMLDEQHPDLKRDPTDNHDNLYVLGSINGHNVAIGCLPAGQTGIGSAAVVATQLLATFKKIRFGLMVGIGGGVPSARADVRLGDVVVSQPDGTFGGVVQYDMGKSTIDGFRRTGSLNAPPQTLLNALSAIQAAEWLGKNSLTEHASRLRGKFQRSRAGHDVLFDAGYDHQGQTCAQCSTDRILGREPRAAGEEVAVHYGTIASGNRVMKSALERDKASTELGGVLCFEMEAAGLMNKFPCLVIRGICDYSDSHKNDRWQAYAAGIAAAYAREVLSVARPVEVAQTAELAVEQHNGNARRDHTRGDAVRNDAFATDHAADATSLRINQEHGGKMRQSPDRGTTLSDEQRKTIKTSLQFKQRDARLLTLKQAQTKTCKWLLKNPKYLDWTHADKIAQHRGFFWIKGKPGSGKSILMKFLFSHAKKSMRKSLVLSFFFNARGDVLEKTTSGLYRALLLQLLEKAPQAWEVFEDDDEIDRTLTLVEHSGWPDELLRQLFVRCLQKLGDHRVVCYVDALDECPENDIRDMILFFEEIGEIESTAEFRVCFSSRHYPEISIRTGLQLVLEAEPEHTNDITLYIDANLKIGDSSQFEDVKAEILQKASGIFLWVHLVVPVLNKEFDTGRIKALKKRLAQFPSGLHDLFVDMLTRDARKLRFLRVSVEVILYAARPLKPEEFRVAVESYCDEAYDEDQYEESALMSPESLRKFVLDSSKGLAEITKGEPTVQWIHESVRDFFLKEGGLNKLRTAGDDLNDSGHNLFVNICLQQLDRAIQPHLPSIWDTAGPFFLLYAVDHLLSHMNDALKSNAEQSSFLTRFEECYRPIWTELYRTFHRAGKNHVHHLYYLAEFGADELIRLHPERETHFSLYGGTYNLPILAALYAGHNAAARALLGLRRAFEDDNITGSQSEAHSNYRLKKSDFTKRRHVLTHLCEYGDPDLLRSALSTPASGSQGIRVSLLYAFALSEDIVDVVASFHWNEHYQVTTSQRQVAIPLNSDSDQRNGNDLPYLRSYLIDLPDAIDSSEVWGNSTDLMTYAASKGFNGIVELCFQLGDMSPYITTALEAAVLGLANQRGRVQVLEQLLRVRPLSDGQQKVLTFSLFGAVLSPHNEDVVRLVLTRTKVDFEAERCQGFTLLLWALSQGRKTYVEMFLDAGANPAAQNSCDGTTAFMLAVKMSDLSSFGLLLHYLSHRSNTRDYYGRTVLSWCAMVADDVALAMIDKLEQRTNIDPNLRDKSGRTALTRAVESANLSIVKKILQLRGIKPDAGSCKRSTPLRLSIVRYIETGHKIFLQIANTLLEHGANLECANKLPTPAELVARHKSRIHSDCGELWQKVYVKPL